MVNAREGYAVNPYKIVNSLNQSVNPANHKAASYLLSYSSKKYPLILYRLDSGGKRSFVGSYAKGEKASLPS